MKNIFVSDLSLTKLEEERERNLLFREKTAVCAFLDSIGADAIELPAIAKPKEDSIVYRTLAASVKRAALSIECGIDEGDIAAVWDCVRDAARPVLRISLPVSTAGMEYSFRMKAPAMLKKIGELCAKARELCSSVEFEAKDATGAERPFLIEALKTAEASGAAAVSICDDLGEAFPAELAGLVSEIKASVGVPLYVKCSDSLGMAAACAGAAIEAGADGLKTAVGGGNCLDTRALSDLIRARGKDLRAGCGLDATRIRRDCDELMKKLSGEVYAPSAVAKEHRAGEIMLGSSCTLPQLSEAAVSLGYELSDEDCGRVYDEVLRLLERKAFVGGRELEAVIAAYAMQVPSTYHLKSYVINASNMTGAMASISLVRDGEEISAVARGDGPIDAAFFAIEQAVGYRYELDDFQIQAVTEGKDSLGSTLIRLRSGGRLFSGNGLSTDIVGASIRAYINALNKIIYEEGRKA